MRYLLPMALLLAACGGPSVAPRQDPPDPPDAGMTNKQVFGEYATAEDVTIPIDCGPPGMTELVLKAPVKLLLGDGYSYFNDLNASGWDVNRDGTVELYWGGHERITFPVPGKARLAKASVTLLLRAQGNGFAGSVRIQGEDNPTELEKYDECHGEAPIELLRTGG